jgi:hypothetical protein
VSLLNYAPADHARLRRLVTPAFTPARIQAYRPAIEEIAQDLADRLGAGPQAGPAHPRALAGAGAGLAGARRRADLLGEFAYPFAGRAVCEAFGIGADNRAHLYEGSLALVAKPRRSSQERAHAAGIVNTVVESEVSRHIAVLNSRVDHDTAGADGDGVLAAVVRTWRLGRVQASKEELLSVCGMLVLAGLETTAQMLCLALVAILSHPPVLGRLRRSPGTVAGMLDELLRWDAPGPFSRRLAVTDVELGGTVIPAGGRVLLSTMGANRDPGWRADPDVFDPARAGGGRHLAFGLGAHYCLGASLARLKLTIAISALIRRWPDMALAVPVSKLTWAGSYVNRGLTALPVDLTGFTDLSGR